MNFAGMEHMATKVIANFYFVMIDELLILEQIDVVEILNLPKFFYFT